MENQVTENDLNTAIVLCTNAANFLQGVAGRMDFEMTWAVQSNKALAVRLADIKRDATIQSGVLCDRLAFLEASRAARANYELSYTADHSTQNTTATEPAGKDVATDEVLSPFARMAKRVKEFWDNRNKTPMDPW